jgi:outer membrane receptor protein involved in Fe transport
MPGLRFNGSGFYYDYTDQQVLSALYTPAANPDSPPTIVGHFVNAPKSHIDGFEVSLEGEILPHLTISQQVGWKEGHYDNFTEFDLAANEETGAVGLANMAGKQIPFPHWSYEGSVAYSAAIGGGFILEPEFDYSFHGYYPSWLGNTFDVPSYWLANLNLTLTPENRHWAVGFWVHNLFDTQYDLTRNFFVPGVNIAAPGRPRSVGGRISVDF